MGVADWILLLVLGGLLGTLGQGIRVVVGLKKLHDTKTGEEAAGVAAAARTVLEPSRLVLSLVIGFVAGALGILTLGPFAEGAGLEKEALLALIAIGYSGTDFIEGFMRKEASPGLRSASESEGNASQTTEQAAPGKPRRGAGG